ncbi:MAG TPA: TonB-dependent receptor, partial [Gemmatimonadaceae bacterium]|nr:TonB-dependent receptor [Gemmatimonadaceae bacterium]
AQTLAGEPGLANRYNGPAASMPVVRGLTGERIVVLQDGERTGDLAATSADHGLTMDPIAAQRVEVVRGPGSLLYGPSAIGGVVNVISNDVPTEVPGGVEGWVGGQAESVNPGGAASAGVTLPLGERFAATVRGSFRDIDDVRTGAGRLPNTSARNWNGLASLGFVTTRGGVGVGYRTFDFNYGVPSAPDAEEGGIRIDGRRHEALLRGSLNTDWAAVPFVKVDGTAQWYEHDEIEPGGEVGTTFELTTQTLNATAKTVLGRLTGAFGAQGLFRDYAATGEEAFTPGARSDNVGLFLFQELPLRGGDDDEHEHEHVEVPALQVGARYDHYRIRSLSSADDPARFGPGRTRSFDAGSGSLGVNVPVGAGVSVAASVARAFRAPTVEELFADGFHAAVGTFDVGNPDLDAEVSTGVDGVLRVQRTRGSAQVSAYFNRVGDFIAAVPVGTAVVDGTEVVPLVNYVQRDADLYGVEGQGELEVMSNLVVGVSGDVVRGRFRDAGPLPFIPAARVGASLRWDDGRFTAGTRVQHAFEQTRVTNPDASDPDAVDIPTDAYTLLDLDVGYTLVQGARAHTLVLRLDNAFDEEFRDATSRIKRFAPNPGRNVSLVYRVEF